MNNTTDRDLSGFPNLTGLNKTAAPKLRFPEFQDAGEWEKKSLGSVCQSFSGGTPLTSEKDFYGGEIPFIRSAEIDKERTELFLTKKGLENSSAKLVKTGDVLVALYGANSGDVALAKLDGAINQAILCLKSEGSNPFIYQFLYHKKEWLVSTYIQGGQGNLSGEIIKSIRLAFPSPAEQQKIADCLTSLDVWIAAQSQKVEALKAYKKGLMQNLFPAEGESAPRLRFPEFESAGDWEEKTLESFCKVGDIDHKMPSSVADGIPYIMTGDFFGINNIDFDNAKKISAEDYEQLSKKIKPEFGDIIIARYASVGAVRYVETKIKFLVSYSCAIIKCNKSESSKYLYYIFQSDATQSKIGLEINSSSQKNIGTDSIKKLNIFLPTLPEQQRIAELLTALDEQISAQSETVAALKVHKNGLMQQLFPKETSEVLETSEV